jgi:hypothetical protein
VVSGSSSSSSSSISASSLSASAPSIPPAAAIPAAAVSGLVPVGCPYASLALAASGINREKSGGSAAGHTGQGSGEHRALEIDIHMRTDRSKQIYICTCIDRCKCMSGRGGGGEKKGFRHIHKYTHIHTYIFQYIHVYTHIYTYVYTYTDLGCSDETSPL